MNSRPRPQFQTVDEYIDHVDAAIAAGVEPWPPATITELKAVFDHFPDYARRWLPAPKILVSIGLPADFGRDPKPLSESFQERILATLEVDAEFRAAVSLLLNGGGAK
ncbi:hypothetical protein Mal52_27270 [Symmachiella dynata]|uniref:Uncharacterized protein n=1 Tax=Symmachiella dynata TaxID=2527995 RepID=A0A517ZP47_9PLAN|nr:hypothetical protein [Symmachiella dynata]QDU44249.1 hypothetical protein Mal52_27270 [Symmachiella dynata]